MVSLEFQYHADLAVRVVGLEKGGELGVAAVVEAFVALGDQPAGPVERLVLATPMAERVILDAAGFVEASSRRTSRRGTDRRPG